MCRQSALDFFCPGCHKKRPATAIISLCWIVLHFLYATYFRLMGAISYISLSSLIIWQTETNQVHVLFLFQVLMYEIFVCSFFTLHELTLKLLLINEKSCREIMIYNDLQWFTEVKLKINSPPDCNAMLTRGGPLWKSLCPPVGLVCKSHWTRLKRCFKKTIEIPLLTV